MEATRAEKAPHIAMVITPDETPSSFSIRSFPTVVVVDKKAEFVLSATKNTSATMIL